MFGLGANSLEGAYVATLLLLAVGTASAPAAVSAPASVEEKVVVLAVVPGCHSTMRILVPKSLNSNRAR